MINKVDYSSVKTTQVATTINDKPWIATVYFVEYGGKYYWLSEPHRRHSKELEINPNCAVAIVIKEDMPVVGLQAEGTAKPVANLDLLAKIMSKYIKKYGVGKEFVKRAKLGVNKHSLYEFTPKSIKIFNESED